MSKFTTLVKPEELAAHLNDPDWVIVDCRHDLADTEAGARAYAGSHVPGARFAHLDKDLSGPVVPGKTGRHPLPEIDQVIDRFSRWGIDSRIQVVAYDDKGGGIAARLWWMLRWLGHPAVAVLDGGWQAWQSGGFPVTDTPPAVQQRTFIPRLQPGWTADANEVESLRQDPAYLVVDSRTPERYSGAVETIDPVAGHIPGAANFPFPSNLENGRFKSPEALKAQFEALADGKPARNTVFYCGSGVTACHNILAWAHAGLGDARLYPGSWSDWITDAGRPVANGEDSMI